MGSQIEKDLRGEQPTIDKFDVKIIKLLVSGGDVDTLASPNWQQRSFSSYDVARKMFGNLEDYKLKLKDNFVRSRLKRLRRIGVLDSVWLNNKRNYFLSNNCRVIRGRMRIGQKTIYGKGTFVVIRAGGMRLVILT